MEKSEFSDAYRYYTLFAARATYNECNIENCESLLLPTLPQNLTDGNQGSHCPTNSKVRTDMWSMKPSVSPSSTKIAVLPLLGTLCLNSQIRDCSNPMCIETRDSMALVAPHCGWEAFRNWALVAMSCQHNLSAVAKVSLANTHLANAVMGCVNILEENRHRPERFHPGLNNSSGASDVAGVCNMIHWLATIQCSFGISMGIEKWDHQFLPPIITMDCNLKAEEESKTLRICKTQLWNLVHLADRTQSDLPAIVDSLSKQPSLAYDYDAKHYNCTKASCALASVDSTKRKQLHKCADQKDCHHIGFDPGRLVPAVERGERTAWLWDLTDLAQQNDKYIAISHVWSDGTGVGVQDRGRVNSCLLEYFHAVAKQLDPRCVALWWDTISIPLDKKARSKALGEMHNNYTHAAYTVVHDSYLVAIDGTNPETACLAIVLSPWFTRGWTALELAMSNKLVFLFKNPDSKDGSPAQRHLDSLLAKSPATSSRAHWIASCMIRRLCKQAQPTRHLRNILTILKPRTTSWVRDRAVIAGLLAKADLDYSHDAPTLTRQIITELGTIPYTCLLHGKTTMFPSGPFSWCPESLDDMPVDKGTDMNGDLDHLEGIRMLQVVDDLVSGFWNCRLLSRDDLKNDDLTPCGNVTEFHSAITSPDDCLLLKGGGQEDEEEPLLLVVIFDIDTSGEFPIIDCEYIGTVGLSDARRNNGGSWKPYEIRLGKNRINGRRFRSADIMEYAAKMMEPIYGLDSSDSEAEDFAESSPSPLETDVPHATDRYLEVEIDPIDEQKEELPWLEYYKPQPVDFTKPLPQSEKSRHLLHAIECCVTGAMRHLIKGGAQLSDEQLLDVEGKGRPIKLKILGDAYLDIGQEDMGRKMHDLAIELLFDLLGRGELVSILNTETMKIFGRLLSERKRPDQERRMYELVYHACDDSEWTESFQKRQAMEELERLDRVDET